MFKLPFAVLLLAATLIGSPASARIVDYGGGFICSIGTTTSGETTWTWQTCYYLGDTGGGGGGNYYPDPPIGGGGGGGSPPDQPPSQVCRDLLSKKPSECETEIQMPTDSEYGYSDNLLKSQYAGGSGLPKLIVFKNAGLTGHGIAAKVDSLLRTHTQQLATGLISRQAIDDTLTTGLQNICIEQDRLMPYPYSAGTKQCLAALNRLVQEKDDATLLSGLSHWIDINNANFTFSIDGLDLNFQQVISALDPANSLHKKSDLIVKDRTCALWWQDARAAGCTQG